MSHYTNTVKYSLLPQLLWCAGLYLLYLILLIAGAANYLFDERFSFLSIPTLIAFVLPQLLFYKYYRFLDFNTGHDTKPASRTLIAVFSVLLFFTFKYTKNYYEFTAGNLITLSSTDELDSQASAKYYSFDSIAFDTNTIMTTIYTSTSKAIGSNISVEKNVLNLWFYNICLINSDKEYSIYFGRKFKASTALNIPFAERQKDSVDFSEKAMKLFKKDIKAKPKVYERVLDTEKKKYYVPYQMFFDSSEYEVFIPVEGSYSDIKSSKLSSLLTTLIVGLIILFIIYIFIDFKHAEFEAYRKTLNE